MLLKHFEMVKWTFREVMKLVWYAEFLLKIRLQFLLGILSARLIFKIMLNSLHIGPDAIPLDHDALPGEFSNL